MPNSGDPPVTRAELHAILREELAAQDARTERRLRELDERLRYFVRDAQTKILRGFEHYATSEHIRFRRLQADVSNIDSSTSQRLDAVEQRLMEIEKKLLLRPPGTV